MEHELKRTEEGVLRVYQQVNPSAIPIEKRDEFERQNESMISLFRDRLKFPLKMFKDAKLLDFGSGTGEKCTFYAMQGAKLTCVEMNPLALKRARQLFDQFGVSGNIENIHNCSLFDFDAGDKRFDIVTSMGVLHHTQDPQKGFNNLVKYLSPGGHVVIVIGNVAGGFQRNLQRLVLYQLSKGDETEMVRLALAFFPDHIERAVKAVGRTKEAMVYDSFINPKIRYVSIAELLEWFADNNIRFYSCWPPLHFPTPFVDSSRTEPIHFEQEAFRNLLSFPELFWMMADQYDKDVLLEQKGTLEKLGGQLNKATRDLNDITPESAEAFDMDSFADILRAIQADRTFEKATTVNNNSSLFLAEVADLIQMLRSGKDAEEIGKKIRTYRMLFRGYCGLGLMSVIGYKQENRG